MTSVGLVMCTRNASIDITKTKISIMDHLPKASSHRKVEPRVRGATQVAGANQRNSIQNILSKKFIADNKESTGYVLLGKERAVVVVI